MLNWIRKIFNRLKIFEDKASRGRIRQVDPNSNEEIVVEPVSISTIIRASSAPLSYDSTRNGIVQAEAYINKLRKKIDILANRFARGELNRIQFERLHDYYRQEIEKTNSVIEEKLDPGQWKRQIIEGQSMLIRRMNAARMIGFSIYETRTLRKLSNNGKISLSDGEIMTLLKKEQSKIGDGQNSKTRFSKLKNGNWCCVVTGEKTITITQFSEEPAIMQLRTLNELQEVFEVANRNTLNLQPIPHTLLVVPYHFYINKEF